METISRSLLTFLLNSLWQIPLVAAVAALGCWSIRSGPAKHRHAVWVAALAAGLLLPLASVWNSAESAAPAFQLPNPPSIAAPVRAFTTAVKPALSGNQTSAPRTRTVGFARTTASVVLAGYILFLAFRLVRLILACIRTAQLRRTATPANPSPVVAAVWKRCEAAFGLTGVELLLSKRASGPVTAGIRRRAIILPESLSAAAPEEVLATAIGHEMAHIARHDFTLNLLYELLALPVSFHPAVAMIRRGIDRTREMACDESVTTRLIDPRVYANAILSIAKTMASLRRPGYALGVFDGDILEERIRRLLAPAASCGGSLKQARLLLATGLAALAACVVIASGLSLTARAQSAARPEMKLAEEAYNRGDFKTAVEHFENAVNLDPNYLNARLYLASVYTRAWLEEKLAGRNPESPLPKAQQQYREVLARDPNNVAAMFGIAGTNLPEKADESRALLLRVIALDPKSKDAYYSVGALDWSTVYGRIGSAKARMNTRADQVQIGDATVRMQLNRELAPQLEEGFRTLQIALDLDPGCSQAMAYMNLLTRAKAALVDSPEDSQSLIAQADQWFQKALALQRTKLGWTKAADQIDVDGQPPMPIPAGAPLAPPPPPPPPPPAGYRGNAPPPPPPPPPPRDQ